MFSCFLRCFPLFLPSYSPPLILLILLPSTTPLPHPYFFSSYHHPHLPSPLTLTTQAEYPAVPSNMQIHVPHHRLPSHHTQETATVRTCCCTLPHTPCPLTTHAQVTSTPSSTSTSFVLIDILNIAYNKIHQFLLYFIILC